MIFIIAPIFVLGFSVSDDMRFLNLVRGVEDERGIFSILKKDMEIKALLKDEKARPEGFRFHYLMMLNNDVEKMSGLNLSAESGIVKSAAVFLANNKYSKNNPVSNERLKQMSECHKELIVVFGPASSVDLRITTEILANKVASFPERDFVDDISAEIDRFENSSWKGSPMLAHLYVVKCRNMVNLRSYGLAYDTILKVKKMHEEICPNKSDPIHLGPVSYEVQSLCSLGKYSDVLTIFRNIPDKLLDNDERKYLSGISRIYSSIATSYYETGKIELAATYQELALGKAYQCFLDRDYPAVIEQAVKLRNILEKKGDLSAMRAIEERFNLKPESK